MTTLENERLSLIGWNKTRWRHVGHSSFCRDNNGNGEHAAPQGTNLTQPVPQARPVEHVPAIERLHATDALAELREADRARLVAGGRVNRRQTVDLLVRYDRSRAVVGNR